MSLNKLQCQQFRLVKEVNTNSLKCQIVTHQLKTCIVMEPVAIPLSKKKIVLLTLGSFAFVTLGVLFCSRPERYVSPVFQSSEFVSITGIACILFFGATGIYGLFKLKDKKVGLMLNNEGIIDNTNATSIGLIPWDTIVHIQSEQLMSTKFILVFTNNSDEILNKARGMKRKLMLANAKMYGTPISITANTLDYDFNALEQLIMNRFYEAKR